MKVLFQFFKFIKKKTGQKLWDFSGYEITLTVLFFVLFLFPKLILLLYQEKTFFKKLTIGNIKSADQLRIILRSFN